MKGVTTTGITRSPNHQRSPEDQSRRESQPPLHHRHTTTGERPTGPQAKAESMNPTATDAAAMAQQSQATTVTRSQRNKENPVCGIE
jgi:hypothetical protein